MAGKYRETVVEHGLDSDPNGWILQGTGKCDESKPIETLIRLHKP